MGFGRCAHSRKKVVLAAFLVVIHQTILDIPDHKLTANFICGVLCTILLVVLICVMVCTSKVDKSKEKGTSKRFDN